MIDFSKIKLVIWDLDETFWTGVLSEGEVRIPTENKELINNLVHCGVMCSICSKNDETDVTTVLTENGINDLFVFKSINWSPKGERIKQIISEMQLREQNVLFIDDNHLNIVEAKQFCPNLICSSPEIILEMSVYFANKAHNMPKNESRLLQYKTLEKKQEFKAKAGSNEEFLKSCNIRVSIGYNCIQHIDRIVELISRTNQLNFTKKRISEKEVEQLLYDPCIKSGFVEVKDNFGDYGIVGFFAIKGNELIHFLFSCRVLNMGVEQYIYHSLDHPKITIVPEVSSSLDLPCPNWINIDKPVKENNFKKALNGNIVLKGPCDLEQMFSFIEDSPNIITEFTYIDDKGDSIEHYNHTTQIINSFILDDEDKKRLSSLPFCDSNMFRTDMFKETTDLVMLSLFNDPHLGVYKERSTGFLMAFGEYLNDITNEGIWDDLINQRLFTAKHQFTIEELNAFKNSFEYIGRLSPKEVFENLKFIFSKMHEDAHLILCLGSETNPENVDYRNHESYIDRHIYHKELNVLVRKWVLENNRIHFIDVNDYITSQNDFLDTINHMKKNIYYEMSKDFIKIANELNDSRNNYVVKQRIYKGSRVSLVDHVKRRMRYIFLGEK